MTVEQISDLLHGLCVDLGFCFGGDAADAFHDDPPSDPESFARAVFLAEGLDYDTDPREGLKRAVLARVAKSMNT